MATKSDSPPRRAPATAHRPMGDDGGLVVVSSEAAVQVLNGVGSKIYGMLDGKHSEDEIVRAVMDEYDVTEDVARRDLKRFLEELETEHMVTPAGATEESTNE